MQYVTQRLWNKWLREYLLTLRKNVKWFKDDVDGFVLLEEDGVKRGS